MADPTGKCTQTVEGGGESNPVDGTGLCLLSLDGGGVRGLSTLYILKGLMTRLNFEREKIKLPRVKPCEVFDLIGGTSTGGLIAIMLGRLEMDVDECISAYSELIKDVFEEKARRLPMGFTGKIKAKFDSSKLKSAVEEVITRQRAGPSDLFNDGQVRGCRVFVCATARETSGTTRLRSYSLPDALDIFPTICGAALASSAATGFFDPVFIGARQFVDGGLGANNPVEEVEGEASNIWSSDTGDLKPLVKCFISIGTGNPGKKAIEDNMVKFLSGTLVAMVTETEETEKKFIARWAKQYDEGRYYRFNVEQGLQNVGLAEYKEQGTIEAATEEYLAHLQQKFKVRDCVMNLKQKQNRTNTNFAAIVHEHNNRIVLLQLTAPKVGCTVPFKRNPRFVDRKPQLQMLEKTLFVDGKPSKVAIFGLGGVGKTQVALEVAYRMREKYPQCSIFWVPAINIESLQQAYLEIGRQLGISGLDEKQDEVKELVRDRLSQESAGQWLLIFDNADDIDMWVQRGGKQTDSPRLTDYLPQSTLGRLIFTTRSREIAVKIAQQNVVEVLEMEEDMARQLLRMSLRKPELLNAHQDTLKLLEQLTFLPLAIVQAAAYINGKGIELREYVSLMEEQEQEVIELLSEDFEEEGRYRKAKNPIASTWLISFDDIQRLHPLAAEYLSFMACVDPRDIPQPLLPPASSRKKGVDAIGTLSAYAFITRTPELDFLNLHRLVHLATRNWLRREGSLPQWAAKVVTRLNELLPDDDSTTKSIWKSYIPHVRFILESCLNKELQGDRVVLLGKFAACLRAEGRYSEAEKSFSQLVEINKRLVGEEDPCTLVSMADLAITYWKQGQSIKAEQLLTEVVNMKRTVLGPKHEDTLKSMNSLALTYMGQGRWHDAKTMLEDVLETLGPGNPAALVVMSTLSSVYLNQGQLPLAAEIKWQILKIRRRELGPEHPFTLGSMGNLATVLTDLGQYKEAENLQLEAIKGQKEQHGEHHPATLRTMTNLAKTYAAQKRWKYAEDLALDVVEKKTTALGAEHPDTLTSINNLASIFAFQGCWKEAEDLEIPLLEARRRVLGKYHPDTISSMGNLATTLYEQGRFQESGSLVAEMREVERWKDTHNH